MQRKDKETPNLASVTFQSCLRKRRRLAQAHDTDSSDQEEKEKEYPVAD